MPDRDMHDLIRSASRSHDESERLAELLMGVSGDRHDPVAREWLRRWTPRGIGPAAADCACATGRCSLCN